MYLNHHPLGVELTTGQGSKPFDGWMRGSEGQSTQSTYGTCKHGRHVASSSAPVVDAKLPYWIDTQTKIHERPVTSSLLFARTTPLRSHTISIIFPLLTIIFLARRNAVSLPLVWHHSGESGFCTKETTRMCPRYGTVDVDRHYAVLYAVIIRRHHCSFPRRSSSRN